MEAHASFQVMAFHVLHMNLVPLRAIATGAWVFALGGMLLLGALGGTAVLLKRRSRVDVSRREAGHTPAKAAVA